MNENDIEDFKSVYVLMIEIRYWMKFYGCNWYRKLFKCLVTLIGKTN